MNNFTFPFEDQIQSYAKNLFISEGQIKFNYLQFYNRVKNFHIFLEHSLADKSSTLTNDPNKKLKVIFHTRYDIDFICLIFACWAQNILPVLISYKTPIPKVNQLADQIKPQLIISIGNKYPASVPVISKLPSKIPISQSTPCFNNFHGDSLALMVFTSGGQGESKGVLHTFKSIYYSAIGSNAAMKITERDSWILSLPANHTAGIMIAIRMFLAGGKVIIPSQFQSAYFALKNTIQNISSDYLSLVPTQLKKLMESEDCIRQLRKFKSILVGGAKCPNNLIEKAISLQIPISLTYGMTEMCASITFSPPFSQLTPPFSCGKVLPYRELVLSATNDILLSGKTLFTFYWSKQKGYYRPNLDHNYFPSKDIGMIDQKGHLFIQKRKDEVFICGGHNIHPSEIEESLRQHNKIDDAKVIPWQDDTFGEIPLAFIETSTNLELSEIRVFLQNQLAPYKWPKKFVLLPSNNPFKDFKYNKQDLLAWGKNNFEEFQTLT